MKIFFASTVISIGLFTVISCNNGSSGHSDAPPSPEVLKAQLRSQEEGNPLQYLTVRGTMTENRVKVREAGVFRDAEYETDGYIIHGTIQNTATVAKYKDVQITVKFLSKTKTVIDSKDFIQYEFYEPNSVTDFTLQVYPPDEMAEWSIEIKRAESVR